MIIINIKETAALMFALICAYCDYKTKEIPVWIITLFGITAVIFTIVSQNKEETIPLFYAFIPGASLLLLSLCTKESLGYGDGFSVLVIGLLVGFTACVYAICMALIFSFGGTVVLLMLRRVNRKSRIPFMPFLAAGLGAAVFGKYIM